MKHPTHNLLSSAQPTCPNKRDKHAEPSGQGRLFLGVVGSALHEEDQVGCKDEHEHVEHEYSRAHSKQCQCALVQAAAIASSIAQGGLCKEEAGASEQQGGERDGVSRSKALHFGKSFIC